MASAHYPFEISFAEGAPWRQPKLVSWFKMGLSLARLALSLPRLMASKLPKGDGRPILVMGNGPSLNEALKLPASAFEGYELVCVNFFAKSEAYQRLQPATYVVLDPLILQNTELPSVREWVEDMVAKTTWPLTLYLPTFGRNWANTRILRKRLPPNVRIQFFRYVVVEGPAWFRHFWYRRQLGYPRSRNVVQATLMIALHRKPSKIFLLGVENDMYRRAGCDDRNRVVIYDTHFYDPDSKPHVRGIEYVANLSEFLAFQAQSLEGYYPVREFARSLQIPILNATPVSSVDAFPRGEWEPLAKAMREA